jgi:hypothetical protein
MSRNSWKDRSGWKGRNSWKGSSRDGSGGGKIAPAVTKNPIEKLVNLAVDEIH